MDRRLGLAAALAMLMIAPQGIAPAEGCVDSPNVVDECGDAMTGDLDMGNANPVIFRGQNLSSPQTGVLRFGSSDLQFRVAGTCAAGSSIRVVNADGTVACEADDDTNSGGTVTSVGSGTGLTGGPITSSGTLSVSLNGGSAQACSGADKASGLSPVGILTCSADVDTNSGGTVTSVASGAGLTGGPITTSGTLGIATGGVTSAMVADGTLVAADADTTSLQARVAGTCVAGQAIRAVAADGTVTCDSGTDWRLGGNAGTTPGTDFLGTTDAVALELKVNANRVLRLEPGSAPDMAFAVPNVVAGHRGNLVTGGVNGATIAGGGGAGTNDRNEVQVHAGTIGGGQGNRIEYHPAGSGGSTVAGGKFNLARLSESTVGGGGGNSATFFYATVGGGTGNAASNTAATVAGGNANGASGAYATVAGGSANSASWSYSTVAGGRSNSAEGAYGTIGGGQGHRITADWGTIPGGLSNTVSGSVGLAAGRQAKALHTGSFVWGDNTAADVASTGANQFIARATGGFWLGNTSSPSLDPAHLLDTSTGAYLSKSGVWTDVSDREAKEGFAPVDPHRVLRQVAALPLTEWSYKAAPGTRHLGPVAQDFRALFGLGEDDRHLAALDTAGVALAAIQGLHQQLEQERARNDALEARLAALEASLEPAG